jgi:GNAT superfamily N-acetyltransferase
MTTPFTIRQVKESDREQWQPLWEGYLVFYESVLPPESTERLWERILDPDHLIQCLAAESTDEPGTLLGMVQFFPHDHTWEEKKVCYLQDLYVDETIRGGGIGAALIQAVEQAAEENDWKFVYWQTKHDNARARGLYDKLTGGANGFIAYRLGSGTATPLK